MKTNNTKYKVEYFILSEKEEITIECKYVKFEEGLYYFLNEDDWSDKDTPIAIFKKENVIKIIKENIVNE